MKVFFLLLLIDIVVGYLIETVTCCTILKINSDLNKSYLRQPLKERFYLRANNFYEGKKNGKF